VAVSKGYFTRVLTVETADPETNPEMLSWNAVGLYSAAASVGELGSLTGWLWFGWILFFAFAVEAVDV
jgi:hypothetical protein